MHVIHKFFLILSLLQIKHLILYLHLQVLISLLFKFMKNPFIHSDVQFPISKYILSESGHDKQLLLSLVGPSLQVLQFS